MTAPSPHPDQPNLPTSSAVAIWLFACCAMVFATLIIGGMTRLTHAGLSIVEWQPLVGAIPPLSHADWQILFAKYQLTPEFILRNHDMDLTGFQYIFWWEWAHRLSGRLIGLVFFAPYFWFILRGQLRGKLAWRVLGFFILGGLQGAMGWYMVQSGLVDDPKVSSIRLAAHLGLAFMLFGLIFWTALGILQPRGSAGAVLPAPTISSYPNVSRFTRKLGAGLIALVFLMVLSGALVAGIHAGLAYNTFPLMNGHLIPPETFQLQPLWQNFFNNMATVQLNHRTIAWALMGLIPWFVWRVRQESPAARGVALVLLIWLGVQVYLGITTLLLRVPVHVAATHQAGAMVLFALMLWVNHAIRRQN